MAYVRRKCFGTAYRVRVRVVPRAVSGGVPAAALAFPLRNSPRSVVRAEWHTHRQRAARTVSPRAHARACARIVRANPKPNAKSHGFV